MGVFSPVLRISLYVSAFILARSGGSYPGLFRLFFFFSFQTCACCFLPFSLYPIDLCPHFSTSDVVHFAFLARVCFSSCVTASKLVDFYSHYTLGRHSAKSSFAKFLFMKRSQIELCFEDVMPCFLLD